MVSTKGNLLSAQGNLISAKGNMFPAKGNLTSTKGNLLSTIEENAHILRLDHPILSNEDFLKIKSLNSQGWKSKTIDITYEKKYGLNKAN